MHLSSNVRVLRLNTGLSYRGFATELGMSTRTIYDIEHNRTENAKLGTVIRLAEYFEVSLDDLVYKDLAANMEENNYET